MESAFGRSLRERAAQIHNRHAWMMKGMLWPRRGMIPAINSVCPGREPGTIFYTLETNEVGGIFAVDAAGLEERILHTADFRVRHIPPARIAKRWPCQSSIRTSAPI